MDEEIDEFEEEEDEMTGESSLEFSNEDKPPVKDLKDLIESLMLIDKYHRVSYDLLKAHFDSSSRAANTLALLEVKGFINKPEMSNRWEINFDLIKDFLIKVSPDYAEKHASSSASKKSPTSEIPAVRKFKLKTKAEYEEEKSEELCRQQEIFRKEKRCMKCGLKLSIFQRFSFSKLALSNTHCKIHEQRSNVGVENG